MITSSGARHEQGSLLDLPARPATPVDGDGVVNPVARVVVDVPLPHLDHPFDYLVPPEMDGNAVPGSRVQVRFAGQDRPAFVVERRADTDHRGTLAPLRRAASPVPVLSPAVLRLCRAVADRYAGTLMDVVRLAVPPRHAATERSVLEKRAARPAAPHPVPVPSGDAWACYTGGPAFLRHLAAGESPPGRMDGAARSQLPVFGSLRPRRPAVCRRRSRRLTFGRRFPRCLAPSRGP
ncbi:hypothetical protein [Georgenia sp. SUBG003]|uniref:primosomal protein N' family DNA-binding protein n=1 Tax=Georgenia sp. SUBG003 TaxID=1497974 RepID=UPI000694B7F7